MLLTGERNGYCSDMHSFLVLDLGNGVQQMTMAQRGVSRPKGSRTAHSLAHGSLGCAGKSCRLGCARSNRQKPGRDKPKVIVNDLSKTKRLPKPDCYSLNKDVLEKQEPNTEASVSVTNSIPVEEPSRSTSPDSVISGLSDDSAASEERQNTLQSVASYLSIGSKDRGTPSSKIESRTDEEYEDEKRSEISTVTVDEVFTETNSIGDEEATQFESSELESERLTDTNVDETEEKNDKKCVTKSASFITPKRDTCKVEFKEDVQINRDDCPCKPNYRLRRMKSFDPTLEKSQTYLHGQNKNFSRANTYLTPARPGLQKLQINYTQTNTENNHLVIFADLIKTSHKRSVLTEEAIKNLERRLRIRRNDPNRATSYYVNKGVKDPIRSKQNKTVRTVAEKDQERKDRIAQATEELKLGYIPTARTIKPVSVEEMKLIRQCSYLRIDPKLQRRESADDIPEVGS